MKKLTIELTDQLAEELKAYLKEHPEESIAELLDEALQRKLTPKDSSQLLSLAGIVTDAPEGAREELDSPSEQTLKEKWEKWFSEVDQLEVHPSSLDYHQQLLNKYRQQGLEL
ncbi:MAG: hypothetical protein ACLFRN_10690 [Halothece sp.]